MARWSSIQSMCKLHLTARDVIGRDKAGGMGHQGMTRKNLGHIYAVRLPPRMVQDV